MPRVLKNFCFSLFFLFFFFAFAVQAKAEVATPEVVEFNTDGALSLIGTAPFNSDALVYLDDVFIGSATAMPCGENIFSFRFTSKEKLTGGDHSFIVVAQDKTSLVLSPPTKDIEFTIESSPVLAPDELPMPAPTVLKPVVNSQTISSRPFIVGLAKNDSLIKIYIDEKYNGEFLVENHKSGTANFAYLPKEALSRGNHKISATAINKSGKASILSNIVEFQVKVASIAQSAEEQAGEKPSVIKDTWPKENFNFEKQKVENQSEPERKENQGLVNETKQNQVKLKIGVALFILFLVGVVAWLIWVNRELVKEQRALAEAEKKKDPENQSKLKL